MIEVCYINDLLCVLCNYLLRRKNTSIYISPAIILPRILDHQLAEVHREYL